MTAWLTRRPFTSFGLLGLLATGIALALSVLGQASAQTGLDGNAKACDRDGRFERLPHEGDGDSGATTRFVGWTCRNRVTHH